METDPCIILCGLYFYFPSPSTNGNATEKYYFNIYYFNV